MNIFTVGGYVRDTLLGVEPNDRDYVVVGATSNDIEGLVKKGFKQVGADFPVFLCPKTGDEYALARVERKVGVGYKGFETFTSPDLCLEDDLIRRDFTFNAMAFDDDYNLIDPFGGKEDLNNGIIRHVSGAFVEDPLRVLRACRFVARYNFKIADETKKLMLHLVMSGELNSLARERVWVELEKILKLPHAYEGLKVMRELGIMNALFHKNFGLFLSAFADFKFNSLNPIAKFAVLCLRCGFVGNDFYRMKVPVEYMKAAMIFDLTIQGMSEWRTLKDDDNLTVAKKKLDLLTKLGIVQGRLPGCTFDYLDSAFWMTVPDWNKIYLEISNIWGDFQKIDCAAIASRHKSGKDIATAIYNARLNVIQNGA